MKRYLILTLALSLLNTAVLGQSYKWKDASGRTIISDTPPPKSAKPTQVEDNSAPPTSSGKAPQPSIYDKELEFKKRQLAAKEKAEKDEKDRAETQRTKAYCDQARRNLAQLESGERIMLRDANGERSFMDDNQRQLDIANLRKDMQSNCK